jgi:hypothetical protein
MKTLEVVLSRTNNAVEITDNVLRSKLIVNDSEIRPEYIEINTQEYKNNKNILLEEPIVRMNFADNKNWKGSMEDLKKDLKLAKLSKKLVKAVQNGSDFDSIVEKMMTLSGWVK